MDIDARSSGTSGTALSGQASPPAPKKAADSRGLNKALHQGAIVSGLLPSLSSSRSGSRGLSSDIYTAVGMQTQGMMSRGLTGIQIANISLGIDMSQAARDAKDTKDAKDAPSKDTSGSKDGDTPAAADSAATRPYSSPDLSNPALGGLLNSLG